MKYYLLTLFVFITGCSHPIPDKKMQVYYSTPKLEGIVSFDSQPLTNTSLFLFTSCNDQQATTDFGGYFNFSHDCMELIPSVNKDELGFLYELIIAIDNQTFSWQISGLGFGIKDITALIDLSTKTVVYQIDDGSNARYEKVDELTFLSNN